MSLITTDLAEHAEDAELQRATGPSPLAAFSVFSVNSVPPWQRERDRSVTISAPLCSLCADRRYGMRTTGSSIALACPGVR